MITYIEKIKTEEQWKQTPHTKMKYFIDDGFIICKDSLYTYTFIKVDDIQAFNYDMPIEKEYVTNISQLEEKNENVLSQLISFEEEFKNSLNAISIIKDNLLLKHNSLNTFYQIPLTDVTNIINCENKDNIINELLEFNQPRDILSPYTVSFEDNTLFVC